MSKGEMVVVVVVVVVVVEVEVVVVGVVEVVVQRLTTANSLKLVWSSPLPHLATP